MKSIHLLLWLALVATVTFSCHKDHNPSITSTAPVLTTIPITDITDTAAAGGGTFTTDGTEVINSKGIQWDTTGQFVVQSTASAGTGTGDFTANLTGLIPNTHYYVRAFAGTDSVHLYYGAIVQFTTSYTLGKYLVSTVAGTGAQGNMNGDTSIATFSSPDGVATDSSGNIYVADSYNAAIRKITPSGTVSTLATLDGRPNDVITDKAGNVYVAQQNFKITRITPSGQVSVFAGSGIEGHVDGTGTSAVLYAAITLAIDPAGNLYVGDVSSFRKITPAGVVSTLTNYFSAGNSCWVIGVDNHFNIYESNGYTAIRVDSNGTETFLAGSGQKGNADGAGSSAAFGFLDEFRLDQAGNIFATDGIDDKIRMITAAGVVTTVAGSGAPGARDGNSAIATFNGPVGLALDNAGNIIITDIANNKIRKISPL